MTTPVNWNKGEDVIVHPSVTNEEAKTLFPDFTTHKVGIQTLPNAIGTDPHGVALLADNPSQSGVRRRKE